MNQIPRNLHHQRGGMIDAPGNRDLQVAGDQRDRDFGGFSGRDGIAAEDELQQIRGAVVIGIGVGS